MTYIGSANTPGWLVYTHTIKQPSINSFLFTHYNTANIIKIIQIVINNIQIIQ